jgi:hypothetical protein
MDRLATGRTTPLGLAYRLGAALVLVAAGWLLSDQWEALGPAGVTLVAGGYLAVTVLGSRAFDARGAHRAAGWMATLAVALTPLVTWAAMWWSGWWPAPPAPHAMPRWGGDRPMLLRVLVLEGVTLGASVLARRAHANAVHTLLYVLSLTTFVFTAWVFVWDTGDTIPRIETVLGLWAGVLLLAGYARDRADAAVRTLSEHPDVWYGAGIVAWAATGLLHWDWFGAWRHAVAPLSAAAWLWAGVQLGRRSFAAAGVLASVSYLLWLAGDVLVALVNGPVALLGTGLLVLLGAVWAQRRFPALLARWVVWRPDAALSVPGGWFSAAVPLAAATVLAAWRSVWPTPLR